MIRAVMRYVRKPCVLSVALLALVPRGEAQVISGTVEGRVTDSSGAVLPGVTIEHKFLRGLRGLRGLCVPAAASVTRS